MSRKANRSMAASATANHSNNGGGNNKRGSGAATPMSNCHNGHPGSQQGPLPPIGSVSSRMAANGHAASSMVAMMGPATPLSQHQGDQTQTGMATCAGCSRPISERYLLKALDQLWHEDCLKCSCCECRLGEVGSTLYTKANLILCKRDYLRLFGSTGICSACNKTIPAFEMVMRAKGNNYHLECFACQRCNHRFCVGDKFYLFDNKVLCEYDYEEVVSQSGQNQSWCTSLEKLRKQTESIETGIGLVSH